MKQRVRPCGRTQRSTSVVLSDPTVVDLFRGQAARTPSALALIDRRTSMSYRELHRRSEAVAAHLLSRCGLRDEEPVAVLADRGSATIVALLGIMKAGGAYLPVDVDYPADRVRFMLDDSDCRIVIDAAARGTEARAEHLLRMDALASDVVAPLREPAATNLAYINYTSGSSGRPKGVMIEHRGLSNIVLDHVALFGVEAADRIVHFSSPAWDAAMFQIFVALVTGAAVVLVPPEVIDDPLRLLGHLDETRATVLSFPPAYLHMLGRARFPFARVLNTGGDASIVDDALFHARSLRSISTYGPTETTICAAYHEVDARRAYPRGIPIGRAARNMRLDVLGPSLERLANDEIGEICIGGPGLARGYLQEQDMTAERFVPDPFHPGERLYRTGDLGRRLPDGEIEFAGRKDRQVKIRGFRVEPAEIEARLQSHPRVGRAVVIPRGDHAHERELIAYTFGKDPVDAAELRAHLSTSLPAAIVPARFVRMPEAPLTAHGKIDLERLPAPEAVSRALERSAPRDAIEQMIVEVWANVLAVESVGVDDDFFEVGGHSLRAAQIVARLRAAGLNAEPSDVITARTPTRLAAALRRRSTSPLPRIERTPAAARHPASHAQARLWFVSQMESESAAYNVAVSHCIDGTLDTAALDHALCDVVARHESLRTNVVAFDGKPWQVVGDAPETVLEIVDACHEANPLDAAARRAREEAQRPFDLAADRLIRAVLVRTGVRQHVLLITVHHAVCDGWSIGRLLEDLRRSYASRVNRTAPLPPLDLQYRDFSAWQASILDGEEGKRRARWWAETLAEVPILSLPADRPRPPARTAAGATCRYGIDRSLLDSLRRMSREHGVSLFMTLTAAVNVLLHRYSGATDIVVGAPMINRPLPELEQQIGFYVETVPLRSAVTPELTIRALLQNVKQTCLDALDRLYPFDALVDVIGGDRDPSRSPLFDVMIALQQESELDLALDGLLVRQFAPAFAGSKFDLSFDFIEAERELEMRIEYRTDLFDATRIDRLSRHIQCLLQAMAVDALARVADVPLLPEAEKELVTSVFATSGVAFGKGETLLDLFAASVAADRERIAVICGERALTYGAMEAQSNALAQHLLARGVRRGDLVGVLLRRSEKFFAALPGIWRAGAGYLPLDPDHPPERLRALVSSAGCRVVVAETATAAALEHATSLLNIDDLPQTPSPSPNVTVDPSDIAYCIFTSGSTGLPKGVLVSHASAVNAAQMWRRSYALDRPVILQMASFVFDVSLGDVCRSLLAGGTAVIATEEERLDPAAIIDLLHGHRISMFETTPAVARLLSEELERCGTRMPALDLLVVGSEPWLAADYERLRRVLDPRTRLLNSYGTTEATVDSAFYDPSQHGHLRSGDRVVPIGRPMESVEVLICDERLVPVPIGVIGELCIGGPGVAIGYLNAPELTARKFVPHPLRRGERVYRTGDRAAWREDGVIAIEGRTDDQVKLRGYRIEPAEIENVLIRCPNVRRAAVVVEQQQLVACVVASEPADEETIRAEAARLLPSYMVPAHVQFVSEIPLTASGKIDRHALRARMPRVAPRVAAEPRTRTERLLAEVWSEVLSLQTIPADVSFFALGGDSIRAVQVVQRCRARGMSMRVIDVFQHASVADLARHLDSSHPVLDRGVPLHLVAPSPAAAALLADGDEDVYPASRMQRMMLRQTERRPQAGLYHGQTIWHIGDDHLSIERWVRAIEWTVQRSPAMRTVFMKDATGELVQVVRPRSFIRVAVEDLRAQPSSAQARRIADFAEADLHDPFVVAQGEHPFCRIRLFVQSPSAFVLFLSMHHALDDGWGAVQWQNELFQTYFALRRGEEPVTGNGHDSFKQFIALEREIESSADARAFWDRELTGVVPQPPAPRRDGHAPAMAFHVASVAPDAVRQLAAHGLRAGVSLKAVCLGRFLSVAESVFTAPECVVGVVSNGRSDRLSDPLGARGLFWNIVPLRVPRSANGAREWFVHDALCRIEPHARYPIPHIVSDADDAPWPPICFNFIRHHGEEAPPAAEGVRILDCRIVDTFHYPLTCAVVVGRTDETMDLRFQYDRRYLDQAEIAGVAERYKRLLEMTEGSARRP